jgi:hypothetical protein
MPGRLSSKHGETTAFVCENYIAGKKEILQ